MYRREHEQIIALRLPNMGLKVGLGSSRVCPDLVLVKDKNISFYGYIDTWILQIYQRYIGIYKLFKI